MPGHLFSPGAEVAAKKDVEALEKLVDEHDVVFLLVVAYCIKSWQGEGVLLSSFVPLVRRGLNTSRVVDRDKCCAWM